MKPNEKPTKCEVVMTLFDDASVHKKLEVMDKMEAMADDSRNPSCDGWNEFADALPLGSTVRLTLEIIDGAQHAGS